VARRLAAITLDNLGDVADGPRRCLFWELGPGIDRDEDPEQVKEAWVSSVLLEWGPCGTLVYMDGVPAGHVFYAPAAMVPRSTSFPTSPVGDDAILLTNAHVRPEFVGQGLGRVLVQTVARDAVKRGIRAVEAFGAGSELDDCLLPVGFLQAVGFKTVRRHPRVPRMRLDLRTTLSWREDVEAALDRLLSTISAGRPSPA
jgi:GNAT superfamily N-acetyltransferase